MTEVLTLSSSPAVQPLHQKIRSRSRWIVALLGVLIAAYLALNAMIIGADLFFPSYEGLGPHGGELFLSSDDQPTYPGFVLLSTFPMTARLIFACGILLATAPGLLALMNLRGLFQLYAHGIVFARENAQRVKNMGVWLIVSAFCPFTLHYTMSYLVSLTGVVNPDNQWYHNEELYEVILGVLLLVVAQVMEVGHEIEQDREQFV